MSTGLADVQAADQLATVKGYVVDTLSGITGLNAVLPYEPPINPRDLPILAVITAGFRRAGLEDPNLSGTSGLRDPLGGRIWVWLFTLRLWIKVDDWLRAQQQTDALLVQVVDTIEADRQLGATVEDCAISQGEIGLVDRGSKNNPLMVSHLDLAVSWTEETGS